MEDGIENIMSTLLNYSNNSNTNIHIHNKLDNQKLYIYIPEGGVLKDYKITNNLQKAVSFSKMKNGKIEVFERDSNDIYNKKD